MTTNSLNDIKASIRGLSAQEVRTLHSWLIASFPYQIDALGDHVAEPAAPYGALAEDPWLSVDEYLELEAKSVHRFGQSRDLPINWVDAATATDL